VRWLAWGVVLAGGLDAMENVFLLGFIRDAIDVRFTLLVSAIATLKFLLIALAVLHIAGRFLVKYGGKS